MAEFVLLLLFGYNQTMPIASEILKELWNTELKCKGAPVNIFGIPRFGKYPVGSIRRTIDRLKERGVLEKELGGIVLSRHGIKYARKKIDSLKQFEKPKGISKERTLLLMFDIPTGKKGEREWLRWHLKKFNYTMVQKSVWVGPWPLPKDFKEYLAKIKLDKHIKIFKLAKSYVK